MKNQAVFLSCLAAMILAFPALAQDTKPGPAQKMMQDMQAGEAAPLDQRYQKCFGDPDCPVQERLGLMEEMHEQMRRTFQRMDQTCRDMDYESCVGAQIQEREQWHKMHTQMGQMMQSMEQGRPGNMKDEAQGRMEDRAREMQRQEPAAGPEKGETRWWNRWSKESDGQTEQGQPGGSAGGAKK